MDYGSPDSNAELPKQLPAACFTRPNFSGITDNNFALLILIHRLTFALHRKTRYFWLQHWKLHRISGKEGHRNTDYLIRWICLPEPKYIQCACAYLHLVKVLKVTIMNTFIFLAIPNLSEVAMHSVIKRHTVNNPRFYLTDYGCHVGITYQIQGKPVSAGEPGPFQRIS